MNTQDTSASSPMTIRPLRLRVDSESEDVRIELVPMIDVIFCILTFFILAAVGFSRQQAISVDIPKARTGTPQGREILMITLDQSGEVYVEQERMLRKEQFKQKLKAYRQQNPAGLMALYASENARYNQVVQVLDFLREVGGERVALATLAGESLQTTNESTVQPPGTSSESTVQPPDTSVPGFNPYQPPATSVPGITPPSPGIEPSPGINPNIEGIPTTPNQQQQGIPNFNVPSPGNFNTSTPDNLQPSLPGDTRVSPNPSPTASPTQRNFAPES